MNLLSNLLRLPLMRLSYRCGRPARAPTSLQADANACDQVRKDMLAQVARCEGADAALLRLRVQRAPDMASLWDLRTRSMQLLAAQFGESDARRSLAGVDSVIREQWPDAPVSRPSPLH